MAARKELGIFKGSLIKIVDGITRQRPHCSQRGAHQKDGMYAGKSQWATFANLGHRVPAGCANGTLSPASCFSSAPTSSMQVALDYNTQREALIIPEYGRYVQRMVQLCLEEEDREKRTKMARAVVYTIGKLNPQLRSNENSDHTFWDHVHVMAGYKLDVDGPYPPPSAEERAVKPKPVAYPKTVIRYGHYGQLVERMIAECIAKPEGAEKAAFTLAIANQMKKQFLTWNRDSVGDGAILKDLAELSKGKLKLAQDQQLTSTEALLQTQRNGPRNAVETGRKRHNNNNGGGGGKKRHRNRKKNRY